LGGSLVSVRIGKKIAATLSEQLDTVMAFVSVYFPKIANTALFIVTLMYRQHIIFLCLFLPSFSHMSLLPFIWLHSLSFPFVYLFLLVATHVEESRAGRQQI
jgi:hypothetical protein